MQNSRKLHTKDSGASYLQTDRYTINNFSDSMESPTPPVASLEAPRPDSPPPVQEEETSLPSEDGLYDKEVSSEETPPETDDTLTIVKEEVKEEVESPQKTPPPVAKRTRVRSGLTPEPEGPGQAKKTRRKPAKRNVGSEPKVNNPRAGGAKRKAAKAASAAVTAAAIQDDNDPDENRNSSGGVLLIAIFSLAFLLIKEDT